MKLPHKLPPEGITAVVDTREQRPLNLDPLRTVQGTLPTADYSLLGLEHHVVIERKSLPDLLSSIGRDRNRFDREVQRLLAYPVRCLVVESTWAEIEAGRWSSKVTASAALGSLLGWVARGLPIIMAGTHERAGRYASRLLYLTARRRWDELRELAGGLEL